MKHRITSLVCGATLAVAPLALAEAVAVDPAIPQYTAVQGVSGSIKSVGSDTMNNEMALWAEGFRKLYPNVKIEIEGKGSSTAPPALTEGTAQFGPMSRSMKDDEKNRFEQKYGYKPTEIRTSIDMLAVYVHKDNPIKCLSLQQVDAIFSKTRRSGASKDVKTWGDLGLTGEWANAPISLYGRNSASGTYGFFKEHALAKGDYKDTVKEQPGTSSVVQAVASDKLGNGYGGIGYKTADVRAVPLAIKTGGECVDTIPENAYTGKYPLARFLYVYINQSPSGSLNPLRGQFVGYVLSQQGQEAVVKDGYLPLTAKQVDEERGKLGLR
ncbi:MAG: phosphate ABC transporter substrate-binding protein PstS family protein [Acidobacteria bacterium]|nr:phosphate ABC transporter substrate-binding protein PstS family protein [Acidobacteriota bacterium]